MNAQTQNVAQPHKILRRHVPDEQALRDAIQAHHDDLVLYDAHMSLVRQGRAQSYPGPETGVHPDVNNAIGRIPQPDGSTYFFQNFELVDYLDVPDGDQVALDAH